MNDPVRGKRLHVQVVYARPGAQWVLPVELEAPATVGEAIAASGLLAHCPEVDLAVNRIGIYGELRSLEATLRDGDRVEVYCPLRADPREARRRRARQSPPPPSSGSVGSR